MTSDNASLTSRFTEPQPPSAEAWSRYLFSDMDALVKPEKCTYQDAFNAAPTAAARLNVEQSAARNGIALSSNTVSQAVPANLRMGSR